MQTIEELKVIAVLVPVATALVAVLLFVLAGALGYFGLEAQVLMVPSLINILLLVATIFLESPQVASFNSPNKEVQRGEASAGTMG
jgi:ABC-type sulfate transport system permease subunit